MTISRVRVRGVTMVEYAFLILGVLLASAMAFKVAGNAIARTADKAGGTIRSSSTAVAAGAHARAQAPPASAADDPSTHAAVALSDDISMKRRLGFGLLLLAAGLFYFGTKRAKAATGASGGGRVPRRIR